jgi:hypothetical protein
VGIDNCGKTFPAMQIFSINEGARVCEHAEGVWMQYMFYDCPPPAVLAADFALGVAAAPSILELRLPLWKGTTTVTLSYFSRALLPNWYRLYAYPQNFLDLYVSLTEFKLSSVLARAWRRIKNISLYIEAFERSQEI